MHHLFYGHAAAPSGLTFTAGADVSYARNMLLVGAQDRLWISRQSLAVVWTLSSVLELGVGVASALATDSVFAGSLATSVLPAVRLKWNAGIWRSWAGGLTASWTAPPLSGASGALSPADATYTVHVLGSRAVKQWELTVNLGLIYDRAGHVGPSVTNPVQLFVDDKDTVSRVSGGIGTAAPLQPAWQHMAFGPYAEITCEWAIQRARLADNPVRLSLGSKVFFDEGRAIEADLGVDIRLLGTPRFGSPYAGLPPWSIFVALSYHSRLGALEIGRHHVVYVPMMVHDKAKPSVVLTGFVRDANALVLSEAHLTVGGDANTVLSVDPSTGRYQTSPLPVAWGSAPTPGVKRAADTPSPLSLEITCAAAGYITQRQIVHPPAQGGTIAIDFHLQREPPSALLDLKVFDAATGKTAAGAHVFIAGEYADEAHLPIEHGHLHTSMRPGRYVLVISAPHYVPRRVTVNLNVESELIVKVSLQRRFGSGFHKKTN